MAAARVPGMAVLPISPRLSPQLDAWDETADTELEVDRATAKGVDFSSAAKLYIDSSRLEGCVLAGAALDKLEMTDTECAKLEAAALQAYKANLLRVVVSDSRFTGAEFAEARFEDCTFRNVKFDQAGFRFAAFKRVRFVDCMLRQADFGSATISHVTFSGCDLEGASFASANCSSVDISTEDLTRVKGVLGLKGATISNEQLIQLAPLLASELGFRIKDA